MKVGCSQGGKASEFGSEIKGSSPFIPDLAGTLKQARQTYFLQSFALH